MTEPLMLKLVGVSKSYDSHRSNLRRFGRWVGIGREPAHVSWALKDVDLELRKGESIAFIGQNGAGKSTLLKVITGTIRATFGTVGVDGRISAMLELGLGFNPEFTGRQNVFLAAGLMGLHSALIEDLLAGIEEFAEVSDYFDQPLRTYSSGMHARLAFAVATCVRPEILIIDEVLSVGDSYFQHKCFERVREYRSLGTSIIFVSHAMGDVRSLCDRVILLDRGQVLRDGPADEVVDYYNAMIAARENAGLTIEQRRLKDDWSYTRSGTLEATVRSLALVDADTQMPLTLVNVGQQIELIVNVEIHRPIARLIMGFLIRDKLGNVIWGTNTWHTGQAIHATDAGQRLEVRLALEARLGPGSYAISHALHASESHVGDNFEWVDNALVFDVANLDQPHFIGSNWLPSRIAVMS